MGSGGGIPADLGRQRRRIHAAVPRFGRSIPVPHLRRVRHDVGDVHDDPPKVDWRYKLERCLYVRQDVGLHGVVVETEPVDAGPREVG